MGSSSSRGFGTTVQVGLKTAGYFPVGSQKKGPETWWLSRQRLGDEVKSHGKLSGMKTNRRGS